MKWAKWKIQAASNVPGEVAAETQPFPTWPLPFDHQGITTDDLIDEDEVPESWVNTLADEPNEGPVRPEIEKLPGLVMH